LKEEADRMEASLLVLLSATVARGLLASAFALVNERRLCSSRASTSGSSRCRTDDLLHAPRGPARRGIEARPRGPLRLLARGVDARSEERRVGKECSSRVSACC